VARVLWVSAETPSRDGQGGQRRQFHQIAALRDRGHDITVLVPASGQDDASIRSLVPVLRPRLTRFHRIRPALIDRMHRVIADPAWDAIVVSHHESSWLLPHDRTAPVLLDVHNVLSHWHRAAGRAEQAEQAHREEAEAVDRATGVTTCSALETRRLLAEHPAAAGRVLTAPLGVDPAEWPDHGFPRDEARLLMFGSWSWEPNRRGLRWFADEVWPRVTARADAAVALVAGTGADELAARTPGIRVVGRVPDLAELAASATVVAVPVLDGVGASVKFAEALASGGAVVATRDGANAFEDTPAFVSDDPAAWAEWIVERFERRGVEPAPAPGRAVALAGMTWGAAVAPIDEWLRAHAA
jgi:polysaccharide biosynthesis protein PslH